MSLNKVVIAAAAASLLLTGTVATAHMFSKSHEVKCVGANSCKGKGSCKTSSSSCKGQNACKGKGMMMVKSKKECTKKGGEVSK